MGRSRTRDSMDSVSSVSSTSIVLEQMNHQAGNKTDPNTPLISDEKYDDEGSFSRQELGPSKTVKTILWAMCALCLTGWLLALFLFLKNGTSMSTPIASSVNSNTTDKVTNSRKPYLGAKRAVKFDDVLDGRWYARTKKVSWINQDGKDGMIMEQGGGDGRDYLVVEDVRSRKAGEDSDEARTLIENSYFLVDGKSVVPNSVWPSPDLKKVLVLSEKKRNWRHSFTGLYWIYDVEKGVAEPLDSKQPNARVQLATWAPTSDSIVFTRDNNIFIRKLDSRDIKQVTTDGGSETFYGIPDWVYEEEVLQTNSATWISEKGEYIAFLRTNETMVPEFPVQYYLSRPSGSAPEPGHEQYPEVRQIKYPKAGAPNPVVNVHFYDVKKGEMFNVTIENDFPDDRRILTEVLWVGNNKILVRETNRESDNLKVVLIDVAARTGKTVREQDVRALDGGWFEVSETTKFIPADPTNGRQDDGYIDSVIIDGYNHIAYFSPLDNPNPKVNLTKGNWEVVKAPSAVDLRKNLVYFIAAKRSPTNRHVYSVKLDGSDMTTVTDDSVDAYYDVSFSAGCGYALLSYKGPDIPTQKIVSTESLVGQKFVLSINENKDLAQMKKNHDLPKKIYQTVNVDGFELQVVERRPVNFDESKKHPVVFYLYNGPASQSVDQKFGVDFQSYLASNLNYIVVTVDGRGTGFSGRKLKCIIRDNIGYYEARDQIETAKIWKAKKYVDPEKIGIWGWSYGGFTTLKTLETDAGETFKYGVAVAPVTDWRFYDSVYTNRYMHTPQHNFEGYNNATITNMQSLAKNVRFLVMHGTSDDNVHMQSSLLLLDNLNLAGISNYDFHAFPDSDHSIFFHNGNKMVYGRKLTHSVYPGRTDPNVYIGIANWFTNAFNGEWLKTANARPTGEDQTLQRRGLTPSASS